MRRTLHLRKDTLTELTRTDLAAVAGGNTPGCPITIRVEELKDMTTAIVTTVIGDFTFQCTVNC